VRRRGRLRAKSSYVLAEGLGAGCLHRPLRAARTRRHHERKSQPARFGAKFRTSQQAFPEPGDDRRQVGAAIGRRSMNRESELHNAPSINGHMIELGARHSIAIYERHSMWWVAEFRDGRVEFADAAQWFAFHAGGLRFCHNRRRAILQTSMPLTPEVRKAIERLHCENEVRRPGMLSLLRKLAATGRRRLMSLWRDCVGQSSRRTGGSAEL